MAAVSESQPIGKVSATERDPSSCTSVRFWVKRGVIIRPFDIVKIAQISQGRGPSNTYAIVQELKYMTDSATHLANYVSSDFGEVQTEPLNSRLGMVLAEAEVIYNDQEIEMPLPDGSLVEWADIDGIRKALGVGDLREPVPAGYIHMSNGLEVPVDVDARYLIGPEGAHLNIAGMSGLATKTSYAMFVLSAIQQRMGSHVSMVVFNVKGSDLLYIDRPNDSLEEKVRKKRDQDWLKCGLEPTPFQNVTYLCPFRENQPPYTLSHIDSQIAQQRIASKQAFNYYYDPESAKHLLGLLFADIPDPNSALESIYHALNEESFDSWESLRNKVALNCRSGSSNKSREITVQSWRRFSRLLKTRTKSDIFTTKPHTNFEQKAPKLVRDAVRELHPGSVLVVDIEPLPDYLQYLVFGDVVQTLYDLKLGGYDERDGEGEELPDLGTVVVFADELNKFAPRAHDGGARTLTDRLLEITERGRSLGVILFGAEQFRSGIHDRVLGNCGTNAYGRTSAVETEKCPDYKHFPSTYRSAALRLPQGTLLLQHAAFKTSLLRVQFPYPAYHKPEAR